MAKIKTTKNGNIQMTISLEQAKAVRDIVGKSNIFARTKMVKKFHDVWTEESDDALLQVYYLINNFNGED